MEKATQSNRDNNPSFGLLSWISQRGFWLLFVSATLLAIAATWLAAQQKPHPDAFRVTAPWHSFAAWFSSDFWLYPYERNAFKRLPVIRSELNDVFALGERVWAVGEDGLIIHSRDGGVTWQQQRVGYLKSPESPEFMKSLSHPELMGFGRGEGDSVESRPQRQQTTVPEIDQQLEGNAKGELSDSEKLFRKQLQSIFFVGAQHGWAVGEGGTILSTVDGGKSWQLQSNNTGTSLVDNDEVILSITGEEKDQHLTYQRYPAPWFYLILLVVALLYAAAFGLRARQNRQAQQQPASIANLGVSDQPAGPGCADLVGARQVALGLTRFLTNENTQSPLTIAITGEWGSGKSSVMNYLFANLKYKGLRPVWFNAWHHREEQNVLASILANIHQQAIRPWWQPAGLWFRMRMLWRRHWLWKLATLLTLLSTAFMLTWLMMTPDKWKDTLRYLRFVINIEQPVVFSERGFNQLCGNWAADQKHAGLSDAALTGELLSWAWVTPRQKPENSPVDKAVAQNIVQEHTQQKADFFSAQECAILHALHSQQRFKRNELNCRDEHSGANDDQSCYVSPRVFLKIAEQKLGATLTHLDEQAIIAALENLSPESPVPFTREVVSLATALFAALAFFVFKGMTLLGFAPVQMMQGILKQSSMVAQPGEKVGARQLFEKHFRRITGLLGRRRLVLFIDDLDRCDREHTRQVLEMTNFLSSSGELFIVLGMAPRYVLANVTLSYRDLAQAVHEADRLGDHAKAHRQESSPGQSWFARHYLQKLIHIEVPVPKPETAQVLALLSFDGKTAKTENDPKREEQRELHVDRFLGYAAKVMRILLLLGAVGVGVYYGNPDWHKAKSMPVDAPPAPVSSGVGAAEVAPEKTVATEVRAQPNEPREQGAVFKAGVDYFDSRPLWIGLAAIAAFAGFGLLLFWAAQRLSRLSNWLAGYPLLVWLKPLLHRLKVMLIGPESMQDSQSFVEALRIWHPMIALKSPTPRTVKAFVNRLRYMASRGDFAAEAHHEAQMVALATIDYCYENNVDEVLALMSQYLAEESGASKIQFEARWPDLASALSLHAQTFGAHPSAQHIAFYQAMNADICIHRQE